MNSTINVPQIIDANINRAAEGLRVIEDYVRFVSQNKNQTQQLSQLRQKINLSEVNKPDHLFFRDTQSDQRAKERPRKRQHISDLLKANFKRVEEALRVLEEYTGIATYNEARYDMYHLEKQVLLPLLKPQLKNGIYLISHNIDVLKKGLEWGVSIIQLRDKNASKEHIYNQCRLIAPLAKKYKIPFIVNDFLDIAQLVDADGLHTGQDDISVVDQRKLLGASKLIGRTTHSLEQGLDAQASGADYVSVGPIWETPSKPNRDGIGFDYLKEAKGLLSVPYVAIGGINKETVNSIISYKPPLIGLIRDYESIPELLKRF